MQETRFQTNGRWYRHWYYISLHQNYRLAMVASDDLATQYTIVPQVIADGYEPTSQQEATHRHAMGLLVARNLNETAAGVVFYTFLASLEATDGSTERVARQIAWYTDHAYTILGAFNREPGAGAGDWLQPLGAGSIVPPRSGTYPSPDPVPGARLDYAIVNGTTGEPPADGVVHAAQDDRQWHRPVLYRLEFTSGTR